MSDSLLSLILCLGALACGYTMLRQAAPHVAPCRRCGDLVQAPRGLPVRCPSCQRWLIV